MKIKIIIVAITLIFTFPIETIKGFGGNKMKTSTFISAIDSKNITPIRAVSFDELMKSYNYLKESFIDKKAENIIKEATSMLKNINNGKYEVYTAKIEGANDYKKKMIKDLNVIISDSSDKAKKQNAFNELSQTLALLVEKLGTYEDVYLQYCPMALNKKGGYWLSFEKGINNPYFGHSMLKCGKVKKEFSKK